MDDPSASNSSATASHGESILWDVDMREEGTFQSGTVKTARTYKAHVIRIGGSLVALVACVLLGHWLWPTGSDSATASDATPGVGSNNTLQNTVSNEDSSPLTTILVDVHGDVRHPGVYRLNMGARVRDVVRVAGGYLHPADANNVNAAAPVNDGDEVVIPDSLPVNHAATKAASNETEITTPQVSVTSQTGTIDLNTANLTTLETLPDIGATRAAAIIAYRTEHGSFRSISELLNVSGIGPVIYSRIAPLVIVAGGAEH